MEQLDWLSPAQAAARLGVTPFRVRQLLTAGRIAHIRTALGRLVDPADVERLARERQGPGGAQRVADGPQP